MNVRSIKGAEQVICDAMGLNRVPATIAVALDASGWLNTTEVAAELVRLRLLQNARPAELSEAQTEALVDAGNTTLNDFYHERACSCSGWPTSCATDPDYTGGFWDTDAFAIGMAAVLGVWESMRAPVEADQIARLLQANAAYERNLERRAAENEALEQRARVLQEENAELAAHVEFRMQDIKRLRARVVELEAAQSQPAPMLDTTTVAAAELVRSDHFHEAARLLEDTGRHDDAANLLDLLADGVREQAAGRAVPSEAPAPHFYRLGRDLLEAEHGGPDAGDFLYRYCGAPMTGDSIDCDSAYGHEGDCLDSGALEDPHDSPLHHAYTKGRDLPVVPRG